MDQLTSIINIKTIVLCCILGCSTLSVATAQLSVTFTNSEPSCNSYTDGNIEAIPDGGVAPYNIVWENGVVGSVQSGLGAGMYALTITDNTGAELTASTTLTEPDPMTVVISNDGDLCLGTSGSSTAAVRGGTSPYEYQWSNGDTSSQSDNLVAGSVSVTVTDVNGCIAVGITEIKEKFEVATEAFDVQCTDFCDGVVKLDLNGGTAPYDIEWSTGTINEASIDLLPPGTYTVTVTDANGCVQTSTAVVGEPSAIDLNLNIADVCDAAVADVSASVAPEGGTAPYNIVWSNGTNGTNTSNLERGRSYAVTVTDALGCTESIDNFEIPAEPSLVLTITATNTSCDNDANGSAQVSATGGTDYEYEWSNNATTATISNLSSGTYTVTVTAANGCSATQSVVVEEGDELLMFPTSINASCTGIDDGMANVLVEGGQLPYSVEWEDGQTTNTAIDLAPGTYSVTATDATGCTGVTTVTVGTNTSLEVSLTTTNSTCDDTNDGSATATVSGGTAPYTYLWSTGIETSTLNDVAAGNYVITITDANGCTTTTTATIVGTERVEPIIVAEVIDCDGSLLTVSFTDESPIEGERNWVFSNGEISSETNPTVQVESGESITATLNLQTSSCSGEATTSFVPQGLDVDIPTNLVACKDTPLQLEVIATGQGTLIYSYEPADLFTEGTTTNQPTVSTTEIGETLVTVTVTDQLGCSATQEVLVRVAAVVDGDADAITISQCEGLAVDFVNENTGISYEYDFGDGSDSVVATEEIRHTFDAPGTYTVTLTPTDEGSCAESIEKQIVVNEPNELAFAVDGIGCSVDGELTFTDNSTYNEDNITYEWVFGNGTISEEPTPTIIVEESGVVEATLTVRLGENCELTKDTTFEVILFDPALAQIPDVMGCRGDTVALNEDANPDLVYLFDEDDSLMGATSSNPTTTVGNENTTYRVTVTDATGQCETTTDVTVNVPPQIQTQVPDDIEQCGDDAIMLEVSSEQAEVITWFENDNEEPLGTGEIYEIVPTARETSFRLRFEDEFGCVVEETIMVRNNNPQVELGTPDKNCGDGTTTVLTTDNLVETDMLSYEWTPDQEGIIDDPTSPEPAVSPANTTTFVATITNQLGCSIEQSVEVEVSGTSGASAALARDTILLGESVDVLTNLNGGLMYSWTPTTGVSDPTTANPVLTPELTTTYTVTIIDPDNPNCTTDRELTVTVLQSNCTEGFIYLPNAFTPNGDQRNDVLFVRGYSITDMRLIIYNRWGEKVFETTAIDNGWDGTYNGEPVCSDVYGYYLEVTCFGGERFVDQGNVTVLR